MKNLVLLVLLALAFSYACNSASNPKTRQSKQFPEVFSGRTDTLEQQYFIKRYRGYLQDKKPIPLALLLVNWGDGRLTGNVYYEDQTGLLPFEGEHRDNGTFTLYEHRFKANNATFNGQFYGTDTLQGHWWNLDSTQSFPFHLVSQDAPEDDAEWTGAWHLNDPWDTSVLIIGGVTEHQFEFAMNIYINDYREYFYGTADIRQDTLAVVDYLDDDIHTENCSLVFHRRGHEVYLEQISFPFLCGLGHNCWVQGHYEDIYTGRIPRMDEQIGPKKIFRDSGLYHNWLTMVGEKNESRFAYSMERLQYTKGWEEFHGLDGSIWEGRVRGFHRQKEGIVCYDKKGNIWAAYTTPPPEDLGPMSVHYFTNAPGWKKRRPVFIKNWMKEFRNCTVVYESAEALQ